jgi:hypothetical protein
VIGERQSHTGICVGERVRRIEPIQCEEKNLRPTPLGCGDAE